MSLVTVGLGGGSGTPFCTFGLGIGAAVIPAPRSQSDITIPTRNTDVVI